ncbi:hypothetical protein PG996_012846 [Apiospora saccharicola]|uniref:Helicase ATP-binding domain-containing protein n=1 Tax=Apiospora saccharicola TaxID=335842 RepID=A0ABR1U3S3_9PEZI
MIQAGYSRTHVSPQPTRVTPYYLNPPQFAQGHNSLADFDFDVTDESYFEPRILESYSVNHHTSNQSIDLQPSSFTDSHAIDICFGSIPDVRTRIRTAFLQPPNYEHIVSLAISPIASFYGVAYSGTVFATISKTNCAVIKQLYGYQRIQVRAFVPYNVLINALSSHSEKSPATLKLDINIYGARDDAHSVGKTLSSGGLILQQPTHGLERVKYYNPHFLHIREFEGEYVEETPQYDLRWTQEAHSEEQNRGKSTVDAAERDTEITTIFNGLAHTEQLQKRAAGRGVKTILRDHQMEAIDFILRRESMPLAPELNMWDEHETDAGDIVYQHAITGTRRAEPLQALGGILADEMGLGKTIVILAVIASTLDEASAYKMEQAVSFDATYQKQRSKATLVIAPSSLLLDSWSKELSKHTFPGFLTYTKYHGPGRLGNINSLYESHIVLTTYATISSEIRRGKIYQKNRTPSMTNYISHDIRNRNTRQFEVAASLATQHRWCLTGTPIQNSLEDLGALIAFLRVPLLEKPQTFQRFIVDQSKQGVNYRFQNLRTLLESVCLRRTKEIIGLADPVQETRELTFTTVERDQYNELLRKYEALVGMEVSGHSNKRASTAKVQSFLKLRLYCNNGLEAASVSSRGLDPDETLTYLQQIDEAVCVYCDSTIFTINNVPGTDGGHILAGCSHLACRDCHVHRHSKDANCPKCIANKDRSMLGIAGLDEAQPREMRNERYPTKLLAFVGDIEQQQSHKRYIPKTGHLYCPMLYDIWICLILSQYRIFVLDKNTQACLPTARKGGWVSSLATRLVRMSSSSTNTISCRLNLAASSRIYLLEPQWNPSIEQQAFGRALRLGQTEQVTIIRYIMKDTVEDVCCTLHIS